MQKGQSNIQPVFDYTLFRNNIAFPDLILFDQYEVGWRFDMKYERGIFLGEIRGCVWLIN